MAVRVEVPESALDVSEVRVLLRNALRLAEESGAFLLAAQIAQALHHLRSDPDAPRGAVFRIAANDMDRRS